MHSLPVCYLYCPSSSMHRGSTYDYYSSPVLTGTTHRYMHCVLVGSSSRASPLANILSSSLCRLYVCNFSTAILACVVHNALINFSHRSPTMFRFSLFFRNCFCYDFFVSFAIVIKRFRELRGESALAMDHHLVCPKFGAGFNPGLRNGSFWGRNP